MCATKDTLSRDQKQSCVYRMGSGPMLDLTVGNCNRRLYFRYCNGESTSFQCSLNVTKDTLSCNQIQTHVYRLDSEPILDLLVSLYRTNVDSCCKFCAGESTSYHVCNEGYTLVGPVTTLCQIDGQCNKTR